MKEWLSTDLLKPHFQIRCLKTGFPCLQHWRRVSLFQASLMSAGDTSDSLSNQYWALSVRYFPMYVFKHTALGIRNLVIFYSSSLNYEGRGFAVNWEKSKVCATFCSAACNFLPYNEGWLVRKSCKGKSAKGKLEETDETVKQADIPTPGMWYSKRQSLEGTLAVCLGRSWERQGMQDSKSFFIFNH